MLHEPFARAGISVAQRATPDTVVRWGMRRAIRSRLATEAVRDPTERTAWLDTWHRGPIAVGPSVANRQHYEVDTNLFMAMLGPRLKYSACLWEQSTDLASAEEEMLAATVEGAGIVDGMRVLDLGCGWGALAGYVAETFPGAEVIAVSNSTTQGAYITGHYPAVRHIVGDVNDFDTSERFDRVVSVEMIEHVRNHPALFARVRDWLSADGMAYIHHFSHARWFWPYEDGGAGDWMARRFFTGGIMPSHDLLPTVLPLWDVVDHRWFAGRHYTATLEAWLARLDASLDPTLPERRDWRWFLMACAEFFSADAELGVTHVGLRPR